MNRAQIADGEQFGIAMITSDISTLITTETVVLNQCVTLKEYVVNTMQNGIKVCIIMQMDAVPVEEGAELSKIGEPVKWDSEEGNALFASRAQEMSVSVSPKGGIVKQESPKTGVAASRVMPQSNFGPSSQGPAGPPGVPLVAARSSPIDALNPYSNKWQIKARVINKGDLRTYNSAKGEGSVFSVDLSDESGEIRATAFNEVANRLHKTLEVGSTYLFARGQLKVANKKFNPLNNPYEISFSFDTQIQLCAEAEALAKPKVHYRFCAIGDIANRPPNAIIDVIGVVNSVSACTSLTSQKTGRELTKRTMVLADDSGKSIELTLWGASATAFPDLDAGQNEVVAFKGMRVTEWNQRSLGASQSSSFEVNPTELEQTDRLKTWWEGGGATTLESLSQDTRGGGGGAIRDESARMTNEEYREAGDGMGAGSEPLYGSVRAFFSKLTLGGQGGSEERAMWYGACPKCNKKVVGDEASGHSCENCGWSGPECTYRYILPLMTLDATGVNYMTAFNEQATTLLGMPADQLKKLKDSDTSAYDAVLAKATWRRYVFRVRGKMDTYNQITRLKSHALSMAPVKWADEGKLLLADIAKYGDLTPKVVKTEA